MTDLADGAILLPETDLLAVFYVPIEGIDGTIQITKSVMDAAGLTADELTDRAKTNALRDKVLAVPDDGQFSFQELLDMVTEINATVVAPQDILSNNVCHFSKNTMKLVHCR